MSNINQLLWGNSATGQPVDGQAVEGCEAAEDCLDGQTLTTSGSNQTVKSTEPGFKGKVDCAETLEEVEELVYRFLKNQYMESIEIISRKAKLHFTYAQGHANFTILKAIVTLDPQEIEHALGKCQEALTACHESRRKVNWFASWFWKIDANDYTDEEIHAELGYAETTILMALLICLTERTIVGLVKAGFRIQSSMSSYLECRRILKQRTKYISDNSKAHFEGGVRMGIGAYNLITSHLPDRILKLVSFMGMGGNRSYGLRQLEKAAYMDKGIRAPLAGMGLLGYYIKVEFILGIGEVNFEYVERLLEVVRKKIDGSALLLIYYGLYEEALGHPKEALEHYETAMSRINYWTEAHHGCHWLMLWCFAVQRQWDKCTEKIKILLDGCRWSPATFNYMYAMFLYIENESKDQPDPEVKKDIARMMSLVPQLRHRIAGKTVHLEKFVELRSYLFFRENETMLMPILDMFYLWNIFPMVQKSPELLQPFLDDINGYLKIYTSDTTDQRHRYYYLIFMKGVILRYSGSMDEAVQCFREVIACESDIQEYTHLPPHAALELGLVYRKLDNYDEARQWLNKAIYEYSNYMNATTVHIRAHTALTIMNTQGQPQGNIEDAYANFEEKLREMQKNKTIDQIGQAAPPADVLQAALEVEDLS
ncbi:Tetratricopeptide repeat protein 39B [Halotydeus destructor]|nr:Tetratricopeptide repeat protein 39B [Halotydeus destructor]